MSCEAALRLPVDAHEEAWCPTRAATGIGSVEYLIGIIVGIVGTELVGACFTD